MGIEHTASRTIARLTDAVQHAGDTPLQRERARKDQAVIDCLTRAGYRAIELPADWEERLLAAMREEKQA